jgi:hypothetical protein
MKDGGSMAYRETENRLFMQNLKGWLQTNPGQYVVIEGDIIIGIFPSAETAYMEAAGTLMTRDFFIKQVSPRYLEPKKPTLVPIRA